MTPNDAPDGTGIDVPVSDAGDDLDREQRAPLAEIVPGDVVKLAAGDMILADVRLIRRPGPRLAARRSAATSKFRSRGPRAKIVSLEFARIALLAALVVPGTFARAEEWTTLDDTIARITVAESENSNRSYTYQYSVTNLDPKRRVMSIEIGYEDGSQDLELATLPVRFVDRDDLPPKVLSGASPKGWDPPSLETQEETPGHYLSWRAQTRRDGIPPGATTAGYSVTLPARDPTHVKAHWTVRFNAGVPASSRLIQVQPSPRPALPLSPDRKRQR